MVWPMFILDDPYIVDDVTRFLHGHLLYVEMGGVEHLDSGVAVLQASEGGVVVVVAVGVIVLPLSLCVGERERESE